MTRRPVFSHLEQAACAQADPELFFPDPTDILSQQQAKAICAGCPLRARCLQWALRIGDQHAILGGLTPLERVQRRTLRDGTPRCSTLPPPRHLDVAALRADWQEARQHATAC